MISMSQMVMEILFWYCKCHCIIVMVMLIASQYFHYEGYWVMQTNVKDIGTAMMINCVTVAVVNVHVLPR